MQQQRVPRPTKADRAYERYVKPLERDHQNEYVLVTPSGQLIFAPTLLEAVQQASMRPNKDNFIFKVGQKSVGTIG